jgi:hypothetical protein
MPFVAGGGDRAGSDDIERDRGWTRRRVKVSRQIEILTASQERARWLSLTPLHPILMAPSSPATKPASKTLVVCPFFRWK